MLIFNSVVYGMFVGMLTDYWLGRGNVLDNRRIIISVVVGVIVGFLVGFGKVSFF